MKMTLNISDTTMKALKREARRRGQTMSALVEAALRRITSEWAERPKLPPLPKFSSGGGRVNVANRRTLHEVMDR